MVACGGAAGRSPLGPGAEVAADGASSERGARFVATGDGWWIERSEDGTDRLIVGGGRFATKGSDIVAVGPDRPVIDHGIAVPPWARSPSGRYRYFFWNQNDLYGAADFTGELTKVATLPGRLRGASSWLDGVALSVGSGMAIVDEQGEVRRPPVRGLAAGLAADARRAVVQSLLGSTLLTVDGGATFQDVTSRLGDVSSFVPVGDDIELQVFGGGRRYVLPSGDLAEVRGSTGPRRDRRPPREGGPWPPRESDPYSLAVSRGVQLSGDTALIVGDQHYAKLDLPSGEVRDVVELPEAHGDCEPVDVDGEPLLVCITDARASVYSLLGEPVLERSFPLRQSEERSWQAEQDRFAAVPGEALGFVGPCAGEIDDGAPDVTSGASALHRSRQRSRAFCVRRGPGRWVEHEVGAADADAVIAWVPRRHGGAAVVVGRNATFMGTEDAVETDLGLLVVRVALEAPPLELPPGSYQAPQSVSTRLHVAADGAVEGWLSSSSDIGSRSSVRIDRTGRVIQQPVPVEVTEIESVGRFAIGSSEDGSLFETVDWGRTWHRVSRVPGHWGRFSGQCTTVGCRFQGVARVGWDGRSTAEPPEEPRMPYRDRYSRPPEEPSPLVRLDCDFDGEPREKRMAKSHGFGVTAQAVTQRRGAHAIGKLGWVWAPNSNRFDAPMTGSLRAAWLRPLDLQAEIQRATLSLDGLGVERSSFWLRVGYALRSDGLLDPFVASSRRECPAPLYTKLGMLKPMGGCHGDASMGVEIGGRVVMVNASGSELRVTAVRPDAAPTTQWDEHRALVKRRWRFVPDRKLAMGRRGDQPVLAAYDGYGDAVSAPIDLERGRLGLEHPLSPLTGLQLGHAADCRKASSDEATFVVPLRDEIGLARSMLGLEVVDGGVAVIRWSEGRACLEAIELNVRDQHLMRGRGRWVDSGTTNKLIARFDGARPRASLIHIGPGSELRQSLTCTGISP